MAILAQGRHIGFRTDLPGLMPRIQERFPPGWKPSVRTRMRRVYSLRVAGQSQGGPRKTHNLYMNGARLARSRDLEVLLDLMESDLQLYVAERATRRIFVHAGVVGWRGNAILIPGRSFSGKSTLVAELLRQGATYYSDEYAALDDEGRVHPFLRPLALRGEDPAARPARHVPADFGAESGRGPLPVGVVAFAHFKPGVRWRPRLLTPGQGVLALLENTVAARRRPKTAFRVLRKAVSGAQLLKGARGEAADIARALLSRVG